MAALSLAPMLRGALDLLYPPRCALCGKEGAFQCETCRDALPVASGDRCDVCWMPLREPFCVACSEYAPAFRSLRAPFRYEDGARKLVHALKYGGQSSLAPIMAIEMLRCAREQSIEADVIVPVPMTGVRQRTRGYNQALLLAREVSKGLGAPVCEVLQRRHHAGTQAKSASAAERRRNVEGAFEAARRNNVAERRVLLIDDVATTGATLDACARALLDGGAGGVTALTFARED